MAEMTYRPVNEDEYPAFVTALIEGFADDLPDEGFIDLIRSTLPPERTIGAFDGGEIVGTFGGYALDVTVPGGCLAMEGTTVVTVLPTHRRMGLMAEMMRRHLDSAVGERLRNCWPLGIRVEYLRPFRVRHCFVRRLGHDGGTRRRVPARG